MASINDEVKGVRRSPRFLEKKVSLPAEVEVVMQQLPKIPRKHLQETKNKAKRKIPEKINPRNKKSKSSATENASPVAQQQNTSETSIKNIDETNSRFKIQLPNASFSIDNTNQVVTINQKITFELTKIVNKGRSELQTDTQTSCSDFDSASTLNKANANSTNSGSNTSDQSVTLTRLSEPTVNKVKSANSESRSNHNLTDCCQDKENTQTNFTHAVNSRTQNITSMSLCPPTRNKADGTFKASIANFSNVYKDAVSMLREECCKNETYEFSQFHNGMYQCQVRLYGKYYFGTGRTKKDAQHSAAMAVLDQRSMRIFFGNTVGMLQELCVRLGWPFPTYKFQHQRLDQRSFTFSCTCSLAHMTVDRKLLEYEEIEQGRTKKIAKRLAALKLLIKCNEVFSR